MTDAAAAFHVAAIGAGMGAKPHFRALDDLRAEFPCAWVCARDAARLQAAPVPQGAQRTTRIDDMLDDPRVRAVLVLTPPASHLELVRRVAAAGKHVLVEKPLDLDLPRAREVVRACEDAGVSLAVMFQYRLRPGALRLAALLRDGAMGALTSASAQVRWWRPQSYYDEPGRGSYARDGGGVLVTQAIHTLDLLLSLIGPPERVTGAMSTSAVHRMESEDCASALLHYANGAVAVVQTTTAAYPGYPERIEINGSLGSATLESGFLKVQWMDGRSEELGADGGSGGGADPMAFDHGPHRAVIADFLQGVRDGRAPQVTGRSALAVHATIAAITDSARSGQGVALAAYLRWTCKELSMAQQHHNFIHGEWVAGASYSPNINPSDTSDVIGEYAQASAAQLDAAVQAAQAAFPAWSTSGIQARHDALDKIGTEILARKEELGTLLAREEGKTRAEGIGEAGRAGAIFKFFAGECLRLAGETLPSVRPGIGVEITREPVGVVGLITPWNFPIAIPAWKIAPALAYGNCVVLKPADLVPGCAWALAEIISRSGIPAGVFNLVMGRGSVIGDPLVNHPGIAAISFTGSQQVGARIAQQCAVNLKKVQLEMGGKNPQVVLDDADLKQAVELSAQSAFFSTGQRCTASSRLIVTAGIHDAFIAALQARMATLKVGDALAAGIDIGPVSSAAQLKQDLDYVDIGQKDGGKLVAGGQRLSLPKDGFYMAPALITDTTAAMRINREEVFGPVASVIRVKDYEEALAVANDTPFGLSAGIATTSMKYATHFKRHSQAGMVMVNLPTAGVDYHVPFGGRKGSSYGPREQGRYAQEFFTTVKTSYTLA